jgi:predicted aspartyl protease
MLMATGFFNAGGSPCVSMRLAGAFTESGDATGVEFEAVVDTGFDGFISMPIVWAFPLRLPLSGLTGVGLGDGSVNDKLTAQGRACVGDRTLWGEVILEPNSDEVLIGLEFLHAFNFALVLAKSEVLLMEENGDWLSRVRGAPESLGVKEPPPSSYLLPRLTFPPSRDPIRTGYLGLSITGRSGQHKAEPR